MSFSSRVKDELTLYMSKAGHCKVAELAGLITMQGEVSISPWKIKMRCESHFVPEKADRIIRELYGLEPSVSIRKGENGSKLKQYTLTLTGPHEVKRILRDMGMLEKDAAGEYSLRSPSAEIFKRPCCRQAYIRGIFLAGGSINDPSKNYHVEILSDDKEPVERAREFLMDYDIESRIIERTRPKGKSVYVLYMKVGDRIGDLLTVMKAQQARMELENIRIVKNVRNIINREVNCETANLNKTVSTSVKQIADIRYLMERGGLNTLSPELKMMAEVRLNNVNTPLKALGELMDPPISKSGVNHRLRKLSELAQKLRDE